MPAVESPERRATPTPVNDDPEIPDANVSRTAAACRDVDPFEPIA